MNIDQLNARFGAPGRIVFHQGHAGYPNVALANKYGTAEVALLGANVLSYRPTGHSEALFRPAKRDYNRSEALHGGIAVCWPQFGNRYNPNLAKHGFARIMPFEVRGTRYTEDETEITLGISSSPETKALWPHDFDLEYKISVSMKLNLTLVTKNTGSEEFGFSCGLHPYLLLRERNDTVVKGLDGCTFVNGITGETDAVQTGDLVLDHETDHIFAMAATPRHEYAAIDPGLHRAIAVASAGNTKTVVWNPGPTDHYPDLGEGDWRRFICVEPVTDWPGGETLAAGAERTLAVAIQSILDERK